MILGSWADPLPPSSRVGGKAVRVLDIGTGTGKVRWYEVV